MVRDFNPSLDYIDTSNSIILDVNYITILRLYNTFQLLKTPTSPKKAVRVTEQGVCTWPAARSAYEGSTPLWAGVPSWESGAGLHPGLRNPPTHCPSGGQ